MNMKTLEQITKLNWFDYLILKSLIEGRKSTPEIVADLRNLMPVYGPGKTASMPLFSQRLKFLVELGLLTKSSGKPNFYEVRSDCKQYVFGVVVGWMGLFDALNPKRESIGTVGGESGGRG